MHFLKWPPQLRQNQIIDLSRWRLTIERRIPRVSQFGNQGQQQQALVVPCGSFCARGQLHPSVAGGQISSPVTGDVVFTLKISRSQGLQGMLPELRCAGVCS